jgi:hypothetical protein
VERLEQRQVPSRGGSAAWVAGPGVYALFQDGSVWSHNTSYVNTDWAQLTSTGAVAATAVSAGLSYHWEWDMRTPTSPPLALAENAAFVRFADGSVWEYGRQDPQPGGQTGWVEVTGSGAVQISAAQTYAQPAGDINAAHATYNSVFILFRDGSVWEHTGLDSTTGWALVTGGGARQISAGQDAAGNAAVFVRYQNGSVWEHTGTDPSAGWTEVTGEGATAVYASPAAADAAFVNFGGDLWQYVAPGTYNAGWTELSSGGVI